MDGKTPTVAVTSTGPDTAKRFAFAFGIPKATAAVDDTARLMTRPRLRMERGLDTDNQIDVNRIRVSHPLLLDTSYEVVLMSYRPRNNKWVGLTSGGKNNRKKRKGWFAALGDSKVTDHAAFTKTGSGGNAYVQVSDLRDFIVKRFVTDSGHTAAELYGRTYAQWAAESNKNRGFGTKKAGSRRFGFAVRYVNPAFTALVDGTRTLDNSTAMIGDVPRYIYSDVAPIDVTLTALYTAPGEFLLRAGLWFGLTE